jgi:hypothetical protein
MTFTNFNPTLIQSPVIIPWNFPLMIHLIQVVRNPRSCQLSSFITVQHFMKILMIQCFGDDNRTVEYDFGGCGEKRNIIMAKKSEIWTKRSFDTEYHLWNGNFEEMFQRLTLTVSQINRFPP